MQDGRGQAASPLPGPAPEPGSTAFTWAFVRSADWPGKCNLLKPEVLSSLNGKIDWEVWVASANHHTKAMLKAPRFGAEHEGL